MATLTVSNYLGMLQDDPENQTSFEGLSEALASGDAARIGDAPLRLIELARANHERRGETRAAAWLIEAELGLAAGDSAFEAALWKELGRLRHEELLDDDGALEAYKRSLALQPNDEVEEIREQIQQTADNWRKIADRFVEEANDASDPSLKSSMLTRAAVLVWQYRKKGKQKEKESDALFTQALAADSADGRAARLYAVTLRDREKWEELGTLLLETGDALRGREEKVGFYLQAGRTFLRKIKDKDRAAQCYERVLDFIPGQDEALVFLVEYFTERELWHHLVALYEDALRSRQKLESEQGILLQLGMVHWRIRKVPAEAEPYFARLRKIDPAHPGMLEFYREHLSGSDEGRLVAILGDAQRASAEDQRVTIALEQARVAQRTGQVERAIDGWKAVQRIDPAHREAHEALRGLYRQGEKWNALVEVIRAEIDAIPAEEAERRVALLRELVPIYRERLQLDAMVINTYNAILQDVPEDSDALRELAKAYESSGRWNDLIQVLTKTAEGTKDKTEKVTLFKRVADLWIDRFANFNQATKPLEEVIALAPEDRAALAQLKDIYTKKRAWKGLYEVLEKETRLAADDAEKRAIQVEMAKLAGDRLHHHADAIALWKEVVATAPATEGALDALEKLAEREKDWATLAEALERRIETLDDDKEKVKVLQKLGAVTGEQLADPQRAATVWKRVLAVDPKNGRALRTLRESFLSAGDFDSLEALYAETSDWEGLADVFTTTADRAENVASKVALSFRAARVFEEKIGEPQRAFRSYERILAVDPSNVEAARKLVPIYQRDEKWSNLARIVETIYRGLPKDAEIGERLAVLERLRSLSLDRLSDHAAAFRWASDAYALAPTDEDVHERLLETVDAASAYEALVDLYRKRLDRADADERKGLRRRIAQIAGQRLGRVEDAVTELRQILADDPKDREAIEVLDQIYRAEARAADLRALYVHRLEHIATGDDKKQLLRELAQLEENVLDDPEAAASHYREAIALDAGDRDALAALDRLAVRAERWEELGKILAQRLEIADDDAGRLELYLRLGELRLDRLDDSRGALDAYSSALEIDRSSDRAVVGIERVADRAPTLAIEAGRLLEPAYQAKGRFGKLAETLKARLERTKDEREVRDLRMRLAELSSSELGDAAGAYQSLEAAFLDRPDDSELCDRLASAAEAAGRQEALAGAYATAIAAGSLDKAAAADLSRRAAELYDIVLGRAADAEPYHKRILEHDPLDEKSFLALKELYTNQERWDELQGLYRTRIGETIDADAKLELLLQVCFLFEEILDDPERAIRSYQEVLELAPDHAGARRSVERLFRRAERWRDLATLIQQNLERAEGQERVDILVELGDLYEKRLEEPRLAVDQYESVLSGNAHHLRAQEALERLIGDATQRQRIATILEPLYESQGAWPQLAKVLDVQLEETKDSGARVGLLTRVAEIQEKRLHDDAKAFAALARAVEADPGDASVRSELARVAGGKDLHRDRATVLERAADAVAGQKALQGEILLELARLWDEQVNDIDAAERVYVRLIAVDGENPDVVLPASRALERIHLRKDDQAALAEDLRRQVAYEPDADVQRGLLVRLADLLEVTLDDVEGAIAAHQKRLENDPSDFDAVRSLERLYERKGEWTKLIEALRAHESASTDAAEQKQILVRIGEVYETSLADTARATEAYNDVVSRFGPDTGALEALVRLYRAGEKWRELLEAIEMQLEATTNDKERAELRFQSAEVLRTKLGETDRAIEVYGEVLAALPAHAGTIQALEEVVAGSEAGRARMDAARVLVPFYESQAVYSSLIRALEVLATDDDPAERLRALRRAAEVAEVGLEDSARAFDLLGRAIRVALGEPDLRTLLSDYERLARVSERWNDYVKTLREVAADILDGDLQLETWMDIAIVARDRLGDREGAREHFQHVLEQQPDHRAALDALEDLHGALGDHAALLSTVRRKTELAASDDERLALYLRQAEICEKHLDDVPAAIDALEQVLMEAPRPEAFEALERLYGRAGRHADLASLYERQLDAQVGSAVETRFRLGRVHLEHLGDRHQAIQQLREALTLDPQHAPTVTALEGLLSISEHRGEAAELLEPVYLARMDWPKVRSALEARIDTEAGLEEKKELLRRLGQMYEDYLEDLEGALETYARLFREDPADRDVWDTLGRLAKVLDRWERLAEIYAGALADVSVDDPDTATLASTAAKLYDEKVGNLEKAAPLYARALRFDPTDRASFDALESVYVRLESWEPLLELYRERVDLAETDEERVTLLHRAAKLREEKLGAKDSAIEAYRRALEINPQDTHATEALDRLLTEAGRWEEVAEHVRFRIDGAAGTPSEIDLKYRLGDLLVSKLGDKQGAVDVFEEIVATTKTHGPTIAALEQLVLEDGLQLRITDILEPLYRESDQWKKLVAVLEARIGLATDPMDRVALLGEVGRLHEERGGDKQRAFQAWSRAFIAAPYDEPTRDELDRLAAELGAWDDLVAAYEQAASSSDDASLTSQLLAAMARVHDERRGDPRAAIETYERLLRHDPEDGSPLDALEALHTMVGDWRGLVDVLNRKVEKSYDPVERADLLRRCGSVLEELLQDPRGAIDVYRRAADEDDRDPVALEALDRLFQTAGQWGDLAGILRRRIEVEEDVDARVEVAMRLGALCDTQLSEPDQAIDAYRRVLEFAPEHAEATTALARLFERQAMWTDLLENLRLQAERSTDPGARVALIFRTGELLERELDDVHEAIDAYRVALEVDSRHEPSLSALLRIAHLEDYRDEAGDIVEPLLRVQERWNDLAELLRLKAEGTTDPFEKRVRLRALAEVHENGRRDLGAAIDALERALAEDAADEETAQDLERLAEQTGAFARVADAFSSRAGSSMDPTTSRGLYARVARIAEARLSDDGRAIDAYQKALEQVGDDEELLAALDRLLSKTQRWPALGTILERRSSFTTDPTERRELLIRLADLRRERFGDARGAFAAYQDIVEEEPGESRVLASLEALLSDDSLAGEVVEVLDGAYRRTETLAKIPGLFDVRIRLADTDGERVRLLQEVAGLLEQDLSAPDRALSALRRAFELDPRDEMLLTDIERLADASGAWASLRGMIESVCERSEVDRLVRRDLQLRAAGWYRDRLGDPASSEARLRSAVEADPDAQEAHAQLVDLLRGGGREADLVAALRAWAAIEQDDFARRERLREAAVLAEQSLHDLGVAAACLTGVLEADATDSDALDALARIRTSEGRWADVVDLLRRRVDVEMDGGARLALRRRVAELYAGPLESPGAAMDAYVQLLEEEPTDLSTIEALEGLYERAERWDDLRGLLDRRLDLATTDAERIAARIRVARLVEQAFGQRREAIEQLREILGLDPGNAAAMDELERLLTGEGAWDELVELVEQRIAAAMREGDIEQRQARLEQLADIHETSRGDTTAAIRSHRRILETDPAHGPSLVALTRLLEASGDYAGAAEAHEARMATLQPADAVEVAFRVAAIAEEKLGDSARAERVLRRAFELVPGSADVRGRLKAHYEAKGQHRELAEILAYEEQLLAEPEQKVAALKHIAQIYKDKLGDPGAAAETLRRASELKPDDRDVLLQLCDLYIVAGRQVDAVPVLQKIVDSYGTKRSKELAQYHHRLGQALEGLGQRDKALEHYDAAFRIDLTNIEILRDLGRTTHAIGDFERAQKTFRALLLQKLDGRSGITKADVYFYLGDISAKQGDKPKAVSMLERAVAEDKQHEQAKTLLASLKG